MDRHSERVSDVNPSRRSFLKGGALAGAALAAGATPSQVNSVAADKSVPALSKLPFKIAGYQYDRVEGLIDGRVQIEGCDARFEVSSIGDMNTHVFSGPKAREVTEIGLSPFMLAFCNEGFRDYALIPVFPLRLFRHKSIFIRTDRGIERPEDLRGRKIATPGYSSTSLIWIRGIVQHEYGVKPNRKALEALFQYSYEQGLASRKLNIDELFHVSTLDLKEEPS